MFQYWGWVMEGENFLAGNRQFYQNCRESLRPGSQLSLVSESITCLWCEAGTWETKPGFLNMYRLASGPTSPHWPTPVPYFLPIFWKKPTPERKVEYSIVISSLVRGLIQQTYNFQSLRNWTKQELILWGKLSYIKTNLNNPTLHLFVMHSGLCTGA